MSNLRQTISVAAFIAATAFGISYTAQHGLAPLSSKLLLGDLEKQVRDQPADDAATENLADLHMQRHETDQAMALYQALSLRYVNGGNMQAAARVLEKQVTIEPRNANFHLSLGAIYARLQQYDNAQIHYNVGSALDPQNADAYGDWALVLLKAGKPQTAETVARDAIRLRPQSAKFHTYLAMALRDQGTTKMSEAMREFGTATWREMDGGVQYAPARMEWARTALQLKQEKGAMDLLQEAITIDRHYTEAKVELARLYLSATDVELRDKFKGVELLDQAIEETKEQDLSLLVNCAAARADLGLFDLSSDLIQKAIANGAGRLSAAQMEYLRQLKLAYDLHDLPTPERPTGTEQPINGLTMRKLDDERDIWPDIPVPPMHLVMKSTLDLSKPPGPDSILDPRLYDPKNQPVMPDLPRAFLPPGVQQ